MTEPVDPSFVLPVPCGDGDMDLSVWLPAQGRGPGIVLVQEIFGVGEWLRAVATELAAEGYVVGAPDLFWRIELGFAPAHDEAGMNAAFAMVGQLDLPRAIDDVVASLDILDAQTQVAGRPAVMGYCLGGTISWLAAAADAPAACVSYYGSGVPDAADKAASITCPTLLHFGGADDFLPMEGVERVRATVDGIDHIELHVHDGAGHAFENDRGGMFHNPEAAARSRAMTLDFLARHLY